MLFRFRGDLVLMTCRELCRCVVEERELRDSDFSEADRGVKNAHSHEDANVSALSAAEAKALREEERKRQKLRSSAPKKIAKLEERISDAEEQLEAIDAKMLQAGADLQKLDDLGAQRTELQETVDAYYEEWNELEALVAELA
ncbi:MAG: hypothetical protein SGPRY_002019 [Prymnesium sp.]